MYEPNIVGATNSSFASLISHRTITTRHKPTNQTTNIKQQHNMQTSTANNTTLPYSSLGLSLDLNDQELLQYSNYCCRNTATSTMDHEEFIHWHNNQIYSYEQQLQSMQRQNELLMYQYQQLASEYHKMCHVAKSIKQEPVYYHQQPIQSQQQQHPLVFQYHQVYKQEQEGPSMKSQQH
jgi:hypothetical protein